MEPLSPVDQLPPSPARFGAIRPSTVTGGLTAVPLIVLFLLNAADELDRVAFGVLLPEIKNYFGVSLATVVGVVSFATFFVLLAAVPLGYLSDRVRRNRLLAGGTSVWGVFSILTAFAQSIPMLAFVRFGSGAAKSLDAAQQSILADYYPPERRPGVFAFHRLGISLGAFTGPLLAGFLATAFFWQVPFLLFGFIGFGVAALCALVLREPVRGGLERLSLGLDAEDVAPPPSFTEAWRLAKSVRTLRRIWYSLPFLSGSIVGILPLLAIYYNDVFKLTPNQRGLLVAFNEPFTVAGLLVGGVIGNRLLRGRPGRVVTLAGLSGAAAGLMFLVIAAAPILPLAVGAAWVFAFSIGLLLPALISLITLVIPARSRAFAISVGSVIAAPGLLFAPIVAKLADSWGIRPGIALLAPVFILGSLILASGGATVDADVRAATAAAAAALASREAEERGRAKMLVVRDLDVAYGQIQILFNVDLDIEAGEIVALLGTNGAGKSTLLNAIAGITPPANGAIFYRGENITHLPDSEHVGRGIVMVPGGKGVFPSLTVAENIKMAGWGRKDKDELAAAIERVYEFFPILRERGVEPAGNLSGGQQQMLALGQAFLSKPELLMIDELSLGLAPAVVEMLLGIVRAIHEGGTTIVLVEQSVNIALTVAQRAVFMEKGQVRFSGPTAELMQRTDILRSVFLAGSQAARGGMALGGSRRRGALEDAAPVLELKRISKSFGGIQAVANVDLVLREGETLGIIGPNGAGKTTVFDIVSGFTEPDAGEVFLIGEDVTFKAADERARMGLQRSFQDARLFPALTVAENIAIALDQRLEARSALMAAMRLPNIARAERRNSRRADRLIDMIGLGDFRDKFLRELSTGTRRLVDLACVLAADPQVLLLDEPSSGVAQKETEELGPLLQRVKFETGCSILIIEHDMPLITSISDELVAMVLGTPVCRGKPDAVLDHPVVIESYLGTSEEVIKRSGQLV